MPKIGDESAFSTLTGWVHVAGTGFAGMQVTSFFRKPVPAAVYLQAAANAGPEAAGHL